MEPAEISPVRLQTWDCGRPEENVKASYLITVLSSQILFIAKPLYSLQSTKKTQGSRVQIQSARKSKRKHRNLDQLPSGPSIIRTVKHQEMLCQLNEYRLRPPLLDYPNFEKPFVQHFQEGLGAVLYQRQDKLVAFGYGSRTRTALEANFHL